MFEGSAHVAPGEHFRRLRLGGNADANATTSADRTNYYQTVPPEQLETALWLESDRMSYLQGNLKAARYLAPQSLHFVVVGDGAAVLPMLTTLVAPDGALPGLLRVVDVDGQ